MTKQTAAHSYLTGLIEGFYGRPWRHQERLSMIDSLAALNLDVYLYAPKSDPFLRKRWDEVWPEREHCMIKALADRCAAAGVKFCPGLSPFELYADYGADRRALLQRRIESLNLLNAPLLAILFDDMPGAQADLAARQADIVADIRCWSTAERLLVCPTYYSDDPVLEKFFGTRPAKYWESLGRTLPLDVDIFWTGREVCAKGIARADLAEINRAVGRPVTLWDNWPVNDGAQRSQHLYLTSPPGRESGLQQLTRGHLCNGMNQPALSLPALAGLAQSYGRIPDATTWLEQTFGRLLAEALADDAPLLAEVPLTELSDAERERLRLRYEGLGGEPASEILAWLNGEWIFDPACLTD